MLRFRCIGCAIGSHPGALVGSQGGGIVNDFTRIIPLHARQVCFRYYRKLRIQDVGREEFSGCCLEGFHHTRQFLALLSKLNFLLRGGVGSHFTTDLDYSQPVKAVNPGMVISRECPTFVPPVPGRMKSKKLCHASQAVNQFLALREATPLAAWWALCHPDDSE